MLRSPKALVIGAAGNIGAPLVEPTCARGYEVLEVDIRPGWRPRLPHGRHHPPARPAARVRLGAGRGVPARPPRSAA